MKDVYFFEEANMYDMQKLIDIYESHIKNVKTYFKNKPEKLIIIDVSKKEDLIKLCNWLDIKTEMDSFPKISSNDIIKSNYNCKFLKR
jgi:hypothetical protein